MTTSQNSALTKNPVILIKGCLSLLSDLKQEKGNE